jgi:hypothetical protein
MGPGCGGGRGAAARAGAPLRRLQHSGGTVEADGGQAVAGQLEAEVARPAGEVEHHALGWEAEREDGAAAPAHVEAEGDHPVGHVVSGGDGVEHGVDRRHLLVAGRQRFRSAQRTQLHDGTDSRRRAASAEAAAISAG